jgi:hypothetical protein
LKEGAALKAVKQSIRGSIAVEAAMIIPIVIIAIMIMLYIMLIIFQTCIMQTTANGIAERAALGYYHDKAIFVGGKTTKANIESLSIYRRWFSNSALEQGDFKAASLEKLQVSSVLKSKSSALDINQTGNVINRKIVVTLHSTYENPMGGMTALWGLGENIDIKVHAEAAIDDPVEFIRNTDFILETALRVPVIKDFEGKWQEIIHKIIEYINSLTKEHGVAYEEQEPWSDYNLFKYHIICSIYVKRSANGYC